MIKLQQSECVYTTGLFVSGKEDWPHMKKSDILGKIKWYERMTFTAVPD